MMAWLQPVWGWWPVEVLVFVAAVGGGLVGGLALIRLVRRG